MVTFPETKVAAGKMKRAKFTEEIEPEDPDAWRTMHHEEAEDHDQDEDEGEAQAAFVAAPPPLLPKIALPMKMPFAMAPATGPPLMELEEMRTGPPLMELEEMGIGNEFGKREEELPAEPSLEPPTKKAAVAEPEMEAPFDEPTSFIEL